MQNMYIIVFITVSADGLAPSAGTAITNFGSVYIRNRYLKS